VFELFDDTILNKIEFFNGGGSGNFEEACNDVSLSEVAVGSAFLQSHIFDYYKAAFTQCAGAFSLQVTRIPAEGIVTCQSGGFIAR
jgi:hypothetical protein